MAAPAHPGSWPPFTIAFQDEHLIVVDKAAGVVVHPARGHREDTLAQLLAPLLGEPTGTAGEGGPAGEGGLDTERRGIVHRLDRDTSGLMVVARTGQALTRRCRRPSRSG